MKKFKIIILLLLITVLYVKAENTVIIAHKGVSDASLDSKTMAKIFTLSKKSWSNGTKIVIFDIKSGTTKTQCYSFMKQTESKLKKLWLKKKLTEGATPPTRVSSDEEMLSKVASTPGAIGYISASKVDGSVKVLTKIP